MAAKKQPRKKPPVRRSKTPVVAVVLDPVDAAGWRAECERLRAELESARAEIATLRTRQDHVLNRIDWVLDSLDSLSETGS
jgi:hypothetical protein